MRQEKSFGVVPILDSPAGRRYLLVQHRAGHWGFPKGKQEKGERPLETARRELREETGIAAVRIEPQPTFADGYRFRKRGGEEVDKTVVYFVGYPDGEKVTVRAEELRGYAWLSAAEAAARLDYAGSRRVLAEVEAHLTGAP